MSTASSARPEGERLAALISPIIGIVATLLIQAGG